MNIPSVGQRFKVTHSKYKEHFIGVIISVDNNPENSDRQFKIAQSERTNYDAIGRPYTQPDSVIEVERNWFDAELTGRKITPITEN